VAVWSAVIAALSLVIALAFNGIQVRDSTAAQQQAKTATELALLAQIQSAMTRSVYSRVPYVEQFRELRTQRRTELSSSAYRVTAEEAANMNYFAWLFNNGYLNAKGADELLGPQMVCEFQNAFAPALKNPAGELSDLVQFIQERRPKLERIAKACA
jgi:hypothetical protein